MSKPSSDIENENRLTERLTELWLSRLLRGGVNAALLLVFIGFLLNYFQGHSWMAATDMQEMLSGTLTLRSDPPRNLAAFIYGFRTLNSLNFVQGAIVILILLPACRVAFLLGGFIRQRDWTFSILALLVLTFMSVGTILRIFE